MGATADAMIGGLLDFFGLLFVYSGGAKLAAGRRFRYQLLAFGLLPRLPSLAVATLLPPLELMAAAGVLGRCRTLECMTAIAILLVLFTVFLAAALASGKELECHCFGGDDGVVDRTTLFRNLFLLALAGLAVAGAALGGGSESWTASRALLAGYAVVAALLFVSALRLLAIRKDLRKAA